MPALSPTSLFGGPEGIQSATGLRPHEPGQLLAQSLRFVYSVFPMTCAWLARRRAAPHGRAALRAAFGGGRRFAPPSAAGRRSARLGETARLARALGLEVGASGDLLVSAGLCRFRCFVLVLCWSLLVSAGFAVLCWFCAGPTENASTLFKTLCWNRKKIYTYIAMPTGPYPGCSSTTPQSTNSTTNYPLSC